MNTLLKTSILSFGLISVLGLTACQSTSPHQHPKADSGAKPERHLQREHRQQLDHPRHQMRGEHHARGEYRRAPLTEEQRTNLEKLRTERQAQYEALQKACEGKVGQTISVKIGEKTLEGSCQVHFKPNKPHIQNITPTQATS